MDNNNEINTLQKTTLSFSYEELKAMLVMLCEGYDKINTSGNTNKKNLDKKIQDDVINKITDVCWEAHFNR